MVLRLWTSTNPSEIPEVFIMQTTQSINSQGVFFCSCSDNTNTHLGLCRKNKVRNRKYSDTEAVRRKKAALDDFDEVKGH